MFQDFEKDGCRERRGRSWVKRSQLDPFFSATLAPRDASKRRHFEQWSTKSAHYRPPSFRMSTNFQTTNMTLASGYQTSGYQASGYQASGCQASGYQASGCQASGYQASGYKASGYQASGFQASGYQAFGFQASGYQAFGYQAFGYQASGFQAFGSLHTISEEAKTYHHHPVSGRHAL
jgi:hypothetical protein